MIIFFLLAELARGSPRHRNQWNRLHSLKRKVHAKSREWPFTLYPNFSIFVDIVGDGGVNNSYFYFIKKYLSQQNKKKKEIFISFVYANRNETNIFLIFFCLEENNKHMVYWIFRKSSKFSNFVCVSTSLPYYYSVLNDKISFSVLICFLLQKNYPHINLKLDLIQTSPILEILLFSIQLLV
jgi:hypothetical protein